MSLAFHLTLDHRTALLDIVQNSKGYTRPVENYLVSIGVNNEKTFLQRINPFHTTEAQDLAFKSVHSYGAAQIGLSYHDWFTTMAAVSIIESAFKMGQAASYMSALKDSIKFGQMNKAANAHANAQGAGTAKGTGNVNTPKYPGNNPSKPPGPGYEWRGSGDPSSGKGNWYNPRTGQTLHPDLNHPNPIGPHWDYKSPDGRVTPK